MNRIGYERRGGVFKIETGRFLELHAIASSNIDKRVAISVDDIGSFYAHANMGCYVCLKGESQPPSFIVSETYDQIRAAIEGYQKEGK